MPNKVLVATAGLVFFVARLGFAVDAADWRSWRGPLGNGSVEVGSYPVHFGADIGSPVPASNRLLIRGEKHLFCVAEE